MSKSKLQKIIAVVGPTSSGKSDLAVVLAKKFNGEVVSADSRQVYKGMDIGTGKITKKEMRDIPHYCLDIVSPQKRLTVVDYQKCAVEAITEIIRKGKIPILAGGTGFYIDAVLYGLHFPVKEPDWKLREKLEKKTTRELLAMLRRIDPRRAKTIDTKNKRRLIRAIEIGDTPPPLKKQSLFNACLVGIDVPKETLKKRIHDRLVKRVRLGMIQEVARLHKNGLSWKKLYEFGLEYRFVSLYLQEKLSKSEMLKQLETAIWHYAKRQMTWFKKNQSIHWIKNQHEAINAVGKFVTSKN